MKRGQEWSEWQITYLKKHYPEERSEDIGVVIGKSKLSVQHKAHRLGLKKDKELFFAVRSKAMSGENSGNFKGYRRKTKKGYIFVFRPNHPAAGKDGLVAEHRLIFEQYIGSYLPKGFVVHHINGIKDDNRIENLALLTISAHNALHNRNDHKQRKRKDNPMYKEVDHQEIMKLRCKGLTVAQVCKQIGIGKTKYYREMRGA